MNFLNSIEEMPGYVKEDRLLAVTTFSFDISVFEISCRYRGAEVIIADTEDIFDAES